MKVYCDDTKKMLKFIVAKDSEETDSFKAVKAQISYEAFMEEDKIWTPEEKTDFLHRVEVGCREVCDWFAEKIKTQK